MRIPLVAVGSNPPRTLRGRTLLHLTSGQQWALRAAVGLLMLVAVPLSIPVLAWWMWGLRRRLWRWYVAAAGLVSTLLVPLLTKGALVAGFGFWAEVLGGVTVASFTIPEATEPTNWAGVIADAWFVGTIVACWMAFLAWCRTPPWRDRERPMTMWRQFRQRKFIAAVESGQGDKAGVVTFGIDTDSGLPVELPWQDTEGHMLAMGAPGTGKTTTALKVVRASIRDGMFTAVVDMKGDSSLIDQVAEWCARWNRPLWVYSEHGPCRYDPFRHGNYTSKSDLLVAASEWSDYHYMTTSLDYLRTLFKFIEALPERTALEGDFAMVQRLLNPNLLVNELKFLKGNTAEVQALREELAELINHVSQDMRGIGGLAPRVRTLRNSHLGQWTRYDNDAPFIDLQDVWDQSGVVLFSIPTMLYKKGAEAFGGLVVNDLTNLASRLQATGNTKPGLVFVDEFSNVGVHNVTPALAMARSSKLRWMLVTQDIGDLRKGANGAADEQKILTDTNIKLIHGVGDADSAEKLARLAGMRWGAKERAAVNLADSAVDITTGTAAGHGFVDRQLVPAIEPTDVMHQGANASSRWILLNKPGQCAITGV
ncbi:type IV secretory system conjugative DNA transfer family protein [Actinotalea sp. C106]|uniref:type IV secretory system conjugative DNA transfer family protein n=1 Tax=Actinotalea sp. C106 TaxID=2908644 RepID=UPI0020284078|nr:TraM recognition domain-containing protein [Actinotalea sp. C106]